MLPCNALEQLLAVCSISFQTLAKVDLASILASVCLPNDLAAYLLKKNNNNLSLSLYSSFSRCKIFSIINVLLMLNTEKLCILVEKTGHKPHLVDLVMWRHMNRGSCVSVSVSNGHTVSHIKQGVGFLMFPHTLAQFKQLDTCRYSVQISLTSKTKDIFALRWNF